MELSEICKKLKTLGLPVAYLAFASPQKLPFVVYFEAGGEVSGADDLDLVRKTRIQIELYTARKDVKLERKLERLFRTEELEKEVDTFLKDEKMFITAYSFENIQSIEEDENEQEEN